MIGNEGKRADRPGRRGGRQPDPYSHVRSGGISECGYGGGNPDV